ncbi:unnamed protein product [Nippostrongylus brasiliensis]|uniref:Ribonuclease 3 (inferred by orthology to a C. elegans protein) n=1 Tax=Nippostrongylus brasiliensis TaxID=27835 RepID=A0A0N4XFQ4_NIPBR|nr:unnamed protein product [Nippostrongylus brasiliensis]
MVVFSNANNLYHYVLVVKRPSGPSGEGTRTRIVHSGDSYVFQGFSVFFHRELPGVLPKMPRPSTIRVDSIRRPSADMPCFAIEHKASPPIAYANLKNPELVDAQRRLNKLRHVQSSASSGQASKEQVDEIGTLMKRINELKQQRAATLNATKLIPCAGFSATGIYADVTAHVLLLILAVKHVRLHWSLSEFEKIIGYKFANRSLIELAFTHPSYKNDFGTNVDHIKTTMTNCLFRRYGPFTENNEKKKGFRNLMHIMSQSGSNTAGLSKVAHNERLEYLGDAVVELVYKCYVGGKGVYVGQAWIDKEGVVNICK